MKDKRLRNKCTVSLSLVVLALAGWLCLSDRLLVSPALSAPTPQAMTFTVTTGNDGGALCVPAEPTCTLRYAINAANNNPGLDTIRFQMGGSNPVKTINLESALPAITDPVIIDGTTQPGYAGQPLIELNGTNAGVAVSGLTITGGGSTIKGLIINRFSADGINVSTGGGNTIQGNYIGTDASGSARLGNGLNGVRLRSANNLVGGTTAEARNVISGNEGPGVTISGTTATGNQLQRNYIGPNAAGSTALGNADGVFISAGAANNTIGGPSVGIGNVISGNVSNGIEIRDNGSTGNKVQANYIGTDSSGNSALPNNVGVLVASAPGTIVGGSTSGARNVISGNIAFGISIISNISATNVQVQGNFIGANVNGAPLGNHSCGVAVFDGSGNSISGNTIAFNQNDGICVLSGTGNLILSNRIFSNSRLAIDLGQEGVTPNDAGDGDTGANNLQNFPLLTSAVLSGGNVTVRGTLNSTPNSAFSILVFSNEECDASGNGEGESSFGIVSGVTTDANGNVSFSLQGSSLPLGSFLTAIAIKLVGGVGIETSEFSPCRQMVSPGSLRFSTASYSVNEGAGTAAITIGRVNGSDGATSCFFTTSNGTASAGQDYTDTDIVVTFVDGETSRTVLVPIADDSSIEDGETVNLTLSQTTGGAPITTPSTAVLTIVDNDAAPTPTPTPSPSPSPSPTPLVSNVQFSTTSYSVDESAGSATITVTRTSDTSSTVTVDFETSDVGARQRTDYTLAAGTLTFAPGDTSKTFRVLTSDDVYIEGGETLSLTLSNPTGGGVLGSPSTATLTITDNDSTSATTNPLDGARFFVQHHYYDFLSRYPDTAGWDFWSNIITTCGTDPACINNRRIDVSNAFYYELEFQQTGSYTYRLYRAAFGNNQPFPNPNPDPAHPGEEKKVPLYLTFMKDRARVRGGPQLPQLQLALASALVQRTEFTNKYPVGLNGPGFVDALLGTINTDLGVNLSSQRQALIDLFSAGGRGSVLYRLADDNVATNPINNRALIDAEYNRAFVFTQYAGYLRRNPDMAGFLFWLGQVNGAPIRDVPKQHAMVCAFITSAEYQQRFSSVVTHNNLECAQ